MNKLYRSTNYVIIENTEGSTYEFSCSNTIYTLINTQSIYRIIEQSGAGIGTYVIPVADISNWFDESGTTAYTEETFVNFLRANTANFSTTSGGSGVDSVNGKSGVVTLNTDDIPEGNNKYFTQAEKDLLMVKSVYDSDDDGIVDKAENIIFKAEINQNVVKGNLLYGVGRSPITNTPIVGLADNTVSFADKTVGMALEDGNAGGIIEVVKIGVIEGINTSLYSVGETVYLSTSGTFDQKQNILSGIFNPVGFVVSSGFSDGAIIIDTTATESIDTDNTLNKSNLVGRTVTDALNTLTTPKYISLKAGLTRPSQTTIPLANQQGNTSYEEYLKLEYPCTVTDNYFISIAFQWSANTNNTNAKFRLVLTDGTLTRFQEVRIEAKDIGGTGQIVDVIENGLIAGQVDTNTDIILQEYFPIDEVLEAGKTYSVSLEFGHESAGSEVTVYSSTIRIEQKTQNP